jgi:hypothetical protein
MQMLRQKIVLSKKIYFQGLKMSENFFFAFNLKQQPKQTLHFE